MADRYGLTGSWGDTSTWSASSGGAGGASVPVATDNVFLDANSGNIAVNSSATCANFVCTGYTGTLSGGSALAHTGGTFTLVAGMTYTYTGTVTFTGANAVGDVTLTRAGHATTQNYTFNGAGKTFKLADAHNIGDGVLTITAGVFDRQGFAITCIAVSAANTNTKTISLGGAAPVNCSSAFNVTGTGTTFTAPDVIKITRQGTTNPISSIISSGVALKKVEISRAVIGVFSGCQFTEAGGGLSIEFLEFVDAPSANWLGCKLVVPVDITIDKCAFPEGTELVSSANGTQRTITTNTDEISFDGCMIRDIAISGGPAIASGCIDLGNNSGITFQNVGAYTHEINGVTYDDSGAILGGCTCVCYEDSSPTVVVSTATSDAVTGAYTLPTANGNAHTVVWTKGSANRGDAMCGIIPTPA